MTLNAVAWQRMRRELRISCLQVLNWTKVSEKAPRDVMRLLLVRGLSTQDGEVMLMLMRMLMDDGLRIF